jgi:hypothetical protein
MPASGAGLGNKESQTGHFLRENFSVEFSPGWVGQGRQQ